ncbi:hypothetical protein [Paraburkholderia tropica]|uniref:hypothetical protein n=1 Tax=Paraburkholderia tropica TaxID=92647 RepID=UPI002ABE40CD|nr:hypothetical protein [Paraburkholderia tropica]
MPTAGPSAIGNRGTSEIALAIKTRYKMTTPQRSWLTTGMIGALCAAISAGLNLGPFKIHDGVVQPGVVAVVHAAAAFVGACLMARFVQGSRAAMQGPVGRAVTTSVFIARVGEFRHTVGGKSAFFSGWRSVQLLGFFLCLMTQFIFVAAPPSDGGVASPATRVRAVSI